MIDTTDRPMAAPSSVETWRCAGCGRIVAKHVALRGRIEVKCKCGAMNVLEVR